MTSMSGQTIRLQHEQLTQELNQTDGGERMKFLILFFLIAAFPVASVAEATIRAKSRLCNFGFHL
jgi:hypothetical protein